MEEIDVGRLIDGRLMREGAGVKLHRYIGVDRTNEFEPILLFDYFDSSDALDYMAGFPPHPHRGFETVTYLLHGTITHEDNQGHKGAIRGGDVQWMTAGKGIIHSEMPSASSGRLQGVQMWLNLPAAKKMAEPRYQELASEQLPLETKDSGAVIKVIAGRTDQGTRSPITDIATKPLFLDIRLPAGASIQQHILRDYQAILFVVSGEVCVGEQKVKQQLLAALTPGDLLTIKGEEESHCLLIAAAKLHEPIARYGPFVMNTQEEVMQALDDFRSGRF
ncbi:pirin family protein [Legionella maioricensis]|uniref:Pirin family protein n=1 Tax=Legionella maioricensis TaxID=2896528 RepID=A0A9X2CYC4_9GAMM|nr:pirin family protein [Legionella maioricensis]MCL9683139.1 pirin family protein [Legionella maioricensis]MCL9688038.1 pirin family protein [Legionella maioricensis]